MEQSLALSSAFIPVQPPRVPDWIPAWKALYGKRLRNVLYGIPEPAFDATHVTRRLLNLRLHFIAAPAMVEHVLLKQHEIYQRPNLTRRIWRPVIGEGLLNSEGDLWRRQRRLVAPFFTPGAVADFIELMVKACRDQLHDWPQAGGRVNVGHMATQTTMSVISRALFSDDPRFTAELAGPHIDRVLAAIGQSRLLSNLGLGEWDPSPVMIVQRRSRRYLRELVATLVAERGPDGGKEDFLGKILRSLHSELPPDEADALAIDNALTFFAAGHETTANTLIWAAYLLAAQPELQEMLRSEAHAALSGPARALPENLPNLRLFIDETLRLYPPVIQIVREAMADDNLQGIDVRRGDLVSVFPWIVHHHRTLWQNPDGFELDRFSHERAASYGRYQYIPFGAGPHICVGARFAIVEALVILSYWLARWHFSLIDGFAPKPAGTVTLRSENGMVLAIAPVR